MSRKSAVFKLVSKVIDSPFFKISSQVLLTSFYFGPMQDFKYTYTIVSKKYVFFCNDHLQLVSEPEVERKKKDYFKILKNNGLSITVKSNLKIACFLDMHFDLVKYLLI